MDIRTSYECVVGIFVCEKQANEPDVTLLSYLKINMKFLG